MVIVLLWKRTARIATKQTHDEGIDFSERAFVINESGGTGMSLVGQVAHCVKS